MGTAPSRYKKNLQKLTKKTRLFNKKNLRLNKGTKKNKTNCIAKEKDSIRGVD